MIRSKNHLQRLRDRAESIGTKEGPAPLFSVETVLQVLSVLYGAAMAIRARLYAQGVLPSRSLPCRVVSIGNIVAGGTGKTPMAIFVAETIRDLGYRVVVISRGYHGRMEKSGGVVSDGCRLCKGPEYAGDEPYLMAAILKDIPVVVGKDRYAAGILAIQRFNPDVIVLDDAFQHMRLKRDVNLVLLDHRSPLGNGFLLPRGRLREPVSALHRAQALIFTRSRDALAPHRIDFPAGRCPVFHSVHAPVIRKTAHASDSLVKDGMGISILQGKKAVAFAGLADNDQFFDSLERVGCLLVHTIAFGDHHRYENSDLARIVATAKAEGADMLATTFKDWVKIEHAYPWPMPVVAVDVRIDWVGDQERFHNFLSLALQTPII